MRVLLAVMPPILGFILTSGQVVGAITGVALFLGVCWRAAVGTYRWMRRIERVIGSNGGSTLFQRMDSLEDAITMHGSVVDVIPEPILAFDRNGEVSSLNLAAAQATAWTLEELRHGGWRQRLSDLSRREWDESVARGVSFEGHVIVAGKRPARVNARPVFNQARLLGWRAVLEF